jgi:hypothetical protein
MFLQLMEVNRIKSLLTGNYFFRNSEYNNTIMQYLILDKTRINVPFQQIGPLLTSLKTNREKMNLVRICGGIFDEARVGVFLFGHDPRNYCNIVKNRRSYLTDKISFTTLKNIKFEIKKNIFILFSNNKKIKIYNFHIHSKLLKYIFLKKNYKKIIQRLNNNLDTVIYYNLKNILKLFFLDFRISRFITLIKRGI